MRRRLRPEEKISRYADRIDGKLRADEQATDRLAVITDSSLRSVMKACGFERRGSRNTAMIQEALRSRNVHPDPPLTTPGLDWEHRIVFSRTPTAHRRSRSAVGFPTECELEAFLVTNFDALFPGMTLVGSQVVVRIGPSKTGKIDILARDKDGYVVIELKLDRPSDDILFAVDKYMDGMAASVERRGGSESVRGLVVSGQVDDKMREQLSQLAQADGRRIDWWEYQLDMKMRPAGGGGVTTGS